MVLGLEARSPEASRKETKRKEENTEGKVTAKGREDSRRLQQRDERGKGLL